MNKHERRCAGAATREMRLSVGDCRLGLSPVVAHLGSDRAARATKIVCDRPAASWSGAVAGMLSRREEQRRPAVLAAAGWGRRRCKCRVRSRVVSAHAPSTAGTPPGAKSTRNEGRAPRLHGSAGGARSHRPVDLESSGSPDTLMITPKAGVVIAARYTLLRMLGCGGMGSVWVARDRDLEIEVALKFMDPSFVASAEARRRFELEAKMVARLSSQHIVQVHDYGSEKGTPYIVMELLEGESLSTRIARDHRSSPAATALILAQICKALRAAHRARIVHRDLKPANIFLAVEDDEEVVKVLDFGIAKSVTQGELAVDTATGAMLGSIHYMSPEQIRSSRHVDHRADLWSVAVILYRMLTGHLPTSGASSGDVLVRVCTDACAPPSSLVPDLAPEIDAFFARALALDPSQRFQSAAEMNAAFAAAVLASPAPPPPPVTSREATAVMEQEVALDDEAMTEAFPLLPSGYQAAPAAASDDLQAPIATPRPTPPSWADVPTLMAPVAPAPRAEPGAAVAEQVSPPAAPQRVLFSRFDAAQSANHAKWYVAAALALLLAAALCAVAAPPARTPLAPPPPVFEPVAPASSSRAASPIVPAGVESATEPRLAPPPASAGARRLHPSPQGGAPSAPGKDPYDDVVVEGVDPYP